MIRMKLLPVIIYAIAILLTFSPAFSFVILSRYFLSASPFTAQVVSVVPMIVGIALLAIIKYKKL